MKKKRKEEVGLERVAAKEEKRRKEIRMQNENKFEVKYILKQTEWKKLKERQNNSETIYKQRREKCEMLRHKVRKM